MKNIRSIMLFLFFLVLVGCSSSAGSFPSNNMIKIKKEVYIASNDKIPKDELADQIGEIEVSSTDVSDHDADHIISSNSYEAGTKLFKIKDKNHMDMIAVEESEEQYVIAYNTKYKKSK